MTLTATSHNMAQQISISGIKRVRLNGSLMEIGFATETTSHNAFTQMREVGIKCTYAGQSAPCGPAVYFSIDRNDFQFHFV